MTKKKRGILIVGEGSKQKSQSGEKFQRPIPERTREQLEPLARRVAEDQALMCRLRAVAGSENEALVREVMDAIIERARDLDSTVSVPEGVRIAITLSKMIGHWPSD
jgi:hypothetical protein